MSSDAKIIDSAGDLVEWREESGFGSQAVAVVSGTFDILQPGNLNLIKLAWQRVGQVCVVVEPDACTAEDDARPWHPVEQRMEFLSYMSDVSAVISCLPDEALAMLGGISPCTWVRCPDHPESALDRAVAAECDTRVELPHLKGCSTVDITRAVESSRTPLDLPHGFHMSHDDETGASRRGRVVTVNGCFDVLHIGHLRFLESAAAMGESLVILLNSDESVQGYKGEERPIFPEEFRVEALRSLSSVADVVLFDDNNPLSVLEEIQPDIHVKGGSFEPDRTDDEKKLVESWGGKLEFCPLVPGFSTTRWVEHICR